jgi:hypothetical protein
MDDAADQMAENVLIERRSFGCPGRRIETNGLPDPRAESMVPPVDDESILNERKYQNRLERQIDQNATERAHVDDLVRAEMQRRQSRFIAADRKLRAVIGSDGDEGFLKPTDEPYNPAPRPASGFIVAKRRRSK